MATVAASDQEVAKAMKILGISCFYHDSAVAAVEDGQIRFAIQEERLSRIKHDAGFPTLAVARALQECGWKLDEVDQIVFYENPHLKLQRIMDHVVRQWPRTWTMFRGHLPRYYSSKYPIERIIRDLTGYRGIVAIGEHHRSHAASTFLTSPFDRALVLTVDGVGEFETTAVFLGEGNALRKLAAIHFPDSLGLLYSALTDYLGFEVNEGEYKVMGLASYGEPTLVNRILGEILHLHKDGSFRLAQRYFDWRNPERHYTPALIRHLGVKPRSKGNPVLPEHEDLAASLQRALEAALRNLLVGISREYPINDVCMAGGVALNCTASAQLIRDLGIRLHIHPAAGDAGGALGAALGAAVNHVSERPYRFPFTPYLGTAHSTEEIETVLNREDIPHRRSSAVASEIASELASGRVVAVLHGRDEWGPRALGNRSILADPRTAAMKDRLNAKIKFREEFRPFAPVVLEEHYSDYFETLGMEASPYMLFTHRALRPGEVAAGVHVDNTSRAQTVGKDQNGYLYEIIKEFYRLTGVPVLINTSFNLKGEPIVSSPSDALKTFFASGIDSLYLEDFAVAKGHDTLQKAEWVEELSQRSLPHSVAE
jgi:carbamoyltransferase